MSGVATLASAEDMVAEYEAKREALPRKIRDAEEAIDAIRDCASVMGTHGRVNLLRQDLCVTEADAQAHLLASAWWTAWTRCRMDILATAADKANAARDLQNPPPFTVENLIAAFGPYLTNPREHVLRGLAEAFVDLDPAYKSHAKVKIGVKGLPKRVIINNVGTGTWLHGYGWDKVKAMLNALSVFNGEGLVPDKMISDIMAGRDTWRGLTFKRFMNGNWHIHFDQDACRQINHALAEFYGHVLPDVEPDKDDLKADPQARSVSKDLQYYPTPNAVAQQIVDSVSLYRVERILEPSCGCGRIMDAVREAIVKHRHDSYQTPEYAMALEGIEFHQGRVDQARAKGHKVTRANFLNVPAEPVFDLILMNPPFYGRHYLKHIRHAMRFLKPGGKLVSILPATAHYDHGELPKGYGWRDLPVGSFAESGVRVPTGYAIIQAEAMVAAA